MNKCNKTILNKQSKYIKCIGKLKRIDLGMFIFKQYKCLKCGKYITIS